MAPIDEDVSWFADAIKARRLAENKSMAKMGQMFDVTEGAYAAWERGESSPHLKRLQLICWKLGWKSPAILVPASLQRVL